MIILILFFLLYYYSKLGVLDASKMFVEVQLANFRGMFQEIQCISESSFPTMMRDVPELKLSYNLFLSIQSKIVQLGKRVKALKTYCATVQLLSPHSNALMRLEASIDDNNNAENRVETDYYIFEEIQRLEKELEFMKQQNNKLSDELYHTILKFDHSPGAMAFYCGLNDPSLIPALKKLKEDLTVLKDFANMADHIDFATLRISLKRCVTASPSLERFVNKYNGLYKRWSQRRAETFYLKQKQQGVITTSPDKTLEMDVCPICCNDRKLDMELQTEIKNKLLLQKIMNVTRSSSNERSLDNNSNNSTLLSQSLSMPSLKPATPSSPLAMTSNSILRPSQQQQQQQNIASSEFVLPKLGNRSS